LDADGACDSASDGSEVKLAPFFAQKKAPEAWLLGLFK
jgi:hypothetical protein